MASSRPRASTGVSQPEKSSASNSTNRPTRIRVISATSYWVRPASRRASRNWTPRLGCMAIGTLGGGATVRLFTAQPGDYVVHLIGRDQHVAGLGALAGPDDAPTLHQVHQPARLGEPDPQLALQHRRRTELRGDH